MPGARSRKLRSGHKRRARRARRHFVLVGTAAVALALTSALSIATLSGIDVAGAAVARAQSIADLLARRSPGERTEAHLVKTKHKHFAVLADHQEAEIPPPAIEKPLVEVFLPPAAAPVIPETLPLLSASAPPLPPPIFAPVIGGAIFAPCCGGGGGPGGGGGGPPAQPPPPSQPPPNQPPAVPEPSSWALMIAGFGLTGFALRRRRGADRPALDR